MFYAAPIGALVRAKRLFFFVEHDFKPDCRTIDTDYDKYLSSPTHPGAHAAEHLSMGPPDPLGSGHFKRFINDICPVPNE